MWRKFMILLLLGRKKERSEIRRIRGRLYKISIEPYESVEDLMERAINSGVFMAHELKE